MTAKRPYNPTNDLLFRWVFGSEKHKNVTIGFINDVLGRRDNNPVRDIVFLDPDTKPQLKDEKLGRLDVFGLLDDQKKIGIEMQVINRKNMPERTLFYWAGTFLRIDPLKAGKDYTEINPTISINILCHKLLPQESPYAVYGIYNIENGHLLTDLLDIRFLEVTKYINKPIGEMTPIERWLAYFANKLTDEQRSELAMSDPNIAEAIAASEFFTTDDAAYKAYLDREMAIMDYNTDMRVSREEGREEGEVIGEERGKTIGENRMGQLIEYLLKDGKTEMIAAIAQDSILRKELFAQYGI